MCQHFFVSALTALLLVHCGKTKVIENDGGPPDNGLKERGLVVLSSDRNSTTVSLLDLKTHEVAADSFLTSGSADPGLSTALSGDVVLPSGLHPKHLISLLDRGNDILTLVDPDTLSVIRQVDVGAGAVFYANPHDIHYVSETKAYLTRSEINSNASPNVDYDDGDDILIINPSDGTLTGNLVLSDQSSRDDQQNLIPARPDRLLGYRGLVWASLNAISGDWSTYGNGVLVAIDPADDTVVQRHELDGLKNCSGLDAIEPYLYVVCSGSWSADQLLEAAVVRLKIDAQNAIESEERLGSEDWFYRPLGAGLAMVNENTGITTTIGGTQNTPPDTLARFDFSTPSAENAFNATETFILGGVRADRTNGFLYLADGTTNVPRLRIYKWENGALTEVTALNPNPAYNLPPREISFY